MNDRANRGSPPRLSSLFASCPALACSTSSLSSWSLQRYWRRFAHAFPRWPSRPVLEHARSGSFPRSRSILKRAGSGRNLELRRSLEEVGCRRKRDRAVSSHRNQEAHGHMIGTWGHTWYIKRGPCSFFFVLIAPGLMSVTVDVKTKFTGFGQGILICFLGGGRYGAIVMSVPRSGRWRRKVGFSAPRLFFCFVAIRGDSPFTVALTCRGSSTWNYSVKRFCCGKQV